MTSLPGPSRWARINAIFHRALDAPPSERARLVASLTADDPTLASDVLSLLDVHERAGDFIEAPAAQADALSTSSLGHLAAEHWVGRTVGHYRIRRLLGQGGMGVVYLADDDRLGRQVALKAVAPQFVDDPARRERLRREARAAAGLAHPGIATVYALEELEGHVFLVVEYVAGETLREELRRGPLPPALAVETILGVARALAAAHERGIVHRDLKPENIMRAPDGAPKVLDFGLARVEAGSGTTITNLTATGTILGTPAYMSPEQVRGQAVDARSDVFALGVILYELVTGTNPFSGSDTTSTVARILESEPPPLVSRSGAVPPGHRELFVTIETVVRASIHKTASARLPSAAAFVAALEGGRVATAGLGSAAAPAAGGSGAAWRSSGVVAPSSAKAPFWWWQFHQGAVSAAYLALFVPIGFAWPRLTEPFGRLLFFAALVPALAAVLLRLHLWFTARAHPETWSNEHRQSAAWIRRADLAFGAVLASGGFLVAGASVPVAAALLGGAVAVVVASVVIEPATRRAAFGE